MRSCRILAHLFLLAPVLVSAQSDTPKPPFSNRQSTLGVGLELDVPIDEFDHAGAESFAGFSANVTAPGRMLPFDYGFDFAYAVMGGKNARVNIPVDTVVEEGELTVKSKMYSYMGQVRLRPLNGRVSPYIEGMIGLRQFTTRTGLDLDSSTDPVSWDRKANAWTGAYGWAAGVLVGLGPTFYIEGRVERLWGGRASYVDTDSINISDSGEVSYGTLSSATDVVNIHLGIGLRF
ncbi:MAG TPA: hypothetical protein VKG92_09240 [Flavobacteriales bacterium]|nr:hypothetical protein [Flavobacteriales bacterium]